MFSTIPPVGVPLDWRTIFAKPDRAGKFARSLAEMFGGQCILTSSGKAALWLILSAMHSQKPHCDEVIVPGYTCWTVPSAVVRAGLRVKLVDIDPLSLGLDPNKTARAISDRTLAVIVTHLLGIPSRIDEIEILCRGKGVFLVDDSAQALGATLNGRATGAFGDAGVLSFGRGKNITTGAGGAAIIRGSELQRKAEEIIAQSAQSTIGSAVETLSMVGYKLLFPRRLFWIPASMPILRLGETVFDTNFEISRLSADRAGRGELMLTNHPNILTSRQNIAAAYRSRLKSSEALGVLPPRIGAVNADLRFPVIVNNFQKRTAILSHGRKFGLSGMYPDTIDSIAKLHRHLVPSDLCPNARMVANQLVTLPTHFNISQADVDRVCDFLCSQLHATECHNSSA